MNAWSKVSSIVLAGLLLTRAWGADADAAKEDRNKLQGEWALVSATSSGQSLPQEALKQSHRVCKGDETTVVVAGELVMKATFKLDPTSRPKRIDYNVTGGPNAGKKQLGIYELEGDQVKFCFAAPGKDRPTDFTTQAGDGRTSSVWKREKK